MSNLTYYAEQALRACSVEEKIQTVQDLQRAWDNGSRPVAQQRYITQPGLPEKLQLVAPKHLSKRKITTQIGHAALLHAVAHIEFNAINLAIDAIYRFPMLPSAYYEDWLKVLHEEVLHFRLLNFYLHDIGYAYGDFCAHNGLWEMALATQHDPLVRMALIPRVMEARGLDVTPGMIEKFTAQQDKRALHILKIIQQDEVGHVRVGSDWFAYLCHQQGQEPGALFTQLVQQYAAHHIKLPLALELRRRAGFAEEELSFLQTVAVKTCS